jgi:hypothetical protein
MCTYNSNNHPNAAPMGAVIKGDTKTVLHIYNSSKSLKNLQNTRAATLNLTSDIDIYYKTALKKDEISAELFEKSKIVNAPKLKICDASIEVSIEQFEPIDRLKTKVTCNVEHIETLKTYPQAYCRARPAVIEAIIHATRIKAFANTKTEQEYVAKLYSLIQNCIDTVNRSAPNSHYTKLMTELQEKIDSWRANP